MLQNLSTYMRKSFSIFTDPTYKPEAKIFDGAVDYMSNLVNNIREYPLIEGVKTHPLITAMGDIKQPDISLSELADIEGSAKLLQEAGALPE